VTVRFYAFFLVLSCDTTMHDCFTMSSRSPVACGTFFPSAVERLDLAVFSLVCRGGLVELQGPVEWLEGVTELGLSCRVQARIHPTRFPPSPGFETQQVADNLMGKVSMAIEARSAKAFTEKLSGPGLAWYTRSTPCRPP
jgi:hypothetical protein